DKQSIARVQGNIGNIYYNLGDFKRAEEKFKLKLQMAKELGDKRAISISLGSLGNVYKQYGDYPSAEEAYSNAIEIAEEMGLKLYVADHSANKARLMLLLGRHSEARALAENAVRLAEELSRSDISLRSRISIAVAEGSENPRAAAKMLLDLLAAVGDNKEHAAEVHYEIYKLTGDNQHKEDAKALYNDLYENTRNFLFKQKLGDLEAH
ncbi:MAG: tetratricopeptide repeat protein, partial [Thermoplasmata archaeon]